MIFDTQEDLIAKPHYPFLFHALQISVQQFMPDWSDTAANSIHFLLMISCMAATYLMLAKRGRVFALVTLSIVIGMPLMTLHTGQSYADITLISFATVSLMTFIRFRETEDSRMLLSSGLFLAACVWTKAEGLFFCYLPWVVMLCFVLVRRSGSIRALAYPVAVSTALSLAWPVFAIVKSLSLTPHGQEDTAIAFSLQATEAMARALFVSGSFGVFWYGALLVLGIVVVGLRTNALAIDYPALITLLWGLLSMLGYMTVYLGTTNTQYLIIGQSFDRQMLLPAALITISLAYVLSPRRV